MVRMRTGGRGLGLLALVATLCLSGVAQADDDQAAELRRQGNEAMQKLEYREAIELYGKALALTPNDAALHYNLGRAHQARGDYAAALRSFEAFTRLATPELRGKVAGLDELMADLRKRVVTLALRCSAVVEPARVILDDRVIASSCSPTPQLVTVSAGKPGAPLEVRLETERYLAATRRVVAQAGGQVDVDFELMPKATSGTLRIRTTPAGADVWVDGTRRGNAGVLEVVVPQGSHTVVAKRDRFEDATVPVVVKADETKDVPVTLQESTPITKKWWFWTAIGVVVAGAATVTTVIIVNTEKDADAGSISPGIIKAPFFRF